MTDHPDHAPLDVQGIVADLDRKLGKILEPGMRLSLLRERLLGCSAEEAVAWMVVVLDRTPDKGSRASGLRDALIELLTGSEETCPEGLPYEVRSDLYAAAHDRGAERLTSLLRTLPAEADASRSRLPKDVAEIPLGRRRALAKGDDPYLLEKLALDPDPTVIENLLRNPRTTEPDVVRIAALRPVPVTTLEVVAQSTRFNRLPRVRVALARNPSCPVTLAVKLVGSLPLRDLKEMRSDPGLREETRSHVVAELERRAG